MAYATQWIIEILSFKNDFELQIIIWTIFATVYKEALNNKLDYFQHVCINWINVWLIDSWSDENWNNGSICLLSPEEY